MEPWIASIQAASRDIPPGRLFTKLANKSHENQQRQMKLKKKEGQTRKQLQSEQHVKKEE